MKKKPYRGRTAVIEILNRAEDSAYVSILLNQVIKSGKVDSKELPLLQKTVKGVLENKAYLDVLLDSLLKQGLDSLPIEIKNCLRVGCYQVLFLDRLPAEVAVDRAVELVKHVSKKPHFTKIVNAVLRKVARERPEPEIPSLEEDPLAHITIKYSHPGWLVSRWIDQFGAEQTAAICRANNTELPMSLRTNTLKLSRDELQAKLQAEGMETVQSTFVGECLLVKELPEGTIDRLESFKRGEFIVQDQASALIGSLVNPKPGETVIDLCSAPGGKTTHMAARMNNKGKVVALDLHQSRLSLIESNCERLGIKIVEAVQGDGIDFEYSSPVDLVLADVPCSGLGVLGRKSDTRWNRDPKSLEELPVLQLNLLRNAGRLVKPGGRVVYSTCSVEKVENEEVVEKFLSEQADFTIMNAGQFVSEELVTEQGYLRTWPHLHKMDGMFGAVLIKKSN